MLTHCVSAHVYFYSSAGWGVNIQSVAMPGYPQGTDEVKYIYLPAKQTKSLSQSVFLLNYSAICVFWQPAFNFLFLYLNSVCETHISIAGKRHDVHVRYRDVGHAEADLT